MNDVTGEHPFALLRRVVGDGPYLERRLGRALAFQVLYEADLARHPTSEILQRVGKDAASPPAEKRLLVRVPPVNGSNCATAPAVAAAAQSLSEYCGYARLEQALEGSSPHSA